ncbi:hypothetical protein IJI55_01630 [Candidatus Saccharibacteria bacterium]|nr:hypothetical protein [Candidatus Saccharibacteria bacterium]MBR3323819.1 hypothetical protein [Candidatus Saccharibacteria bacterium]
MATKTTAKTTKTTKKTNKKTTNIAIPIIGGIIAAFAIVGVVIGATIIVDNINKSKRVGAYKLSSLYLNGEEENSVDLLNALGLTADIELRNDNTCTTNIFGESHTCTYDDTTLYIADTNTNTPYTYENNTIQFESNGNRMTFTRISE